MVGESHVGKTSMMVKYVGGKFDTDYCETMGVFEQPPSRPFAFLALWIASQTNLI